MSDGIIKPTVGRIVHVTTIGHADEQPWAGIIACVHSDRLVDVHIFPPAPRSARVVARCPLVQPGDDKPKDGGYCEWMPYQKGQAAKTEAMQDQLAALADVTPSERAAHAAGRCSDKGDPTVNQHLQPTEPPTDS